LKTIFCSACGAEMTNHGKIPDGVLFYCKNCGSKKIVIENYESKKDEAGYGNAYREHLDVTKFIQLIDLFEKNYSIVNYNLKLLDVGFGNGNFLLTLEKKGIKVSGLESDMNAVNLIKQKGVPAYFGELGGELEVKEKYDLITLWDVLEHINYIEKALLQLSNLMNKKGRIFVITPNADSIFDILAGIERYFTFFRSQRIMSICLNKYHLHRFSAKGLKILFERYGFTVEHLELIQLFSLKPDTYTDGFAPGIMKWTDSSVINKIISKRAMNIIKMLNLRNKIFLTAVRE
jgi:2-polyprenyl-3-methyl-5-hydroxy-6-metoxy-1,4-benzoquinol methylase